MSITETQGIMTGPLWKDKIKMVGTALKVQKEELLFAKKINKMYIISGSVWRDE